MATGSFIMLLAIIQMSRPLQIKVKDDSLNVGLAAAVDVINSGFNNVPSTLSIILDGKTYSSTGSQFIGKTGTDLGVSIFEVFASDQVKNNLTVSSITSSMEQLRTTSRSLNVIVASDDSVFLLAITRRMFNAGLLDWTKKLLVITQSQISKLQKLSKYFSITNSMVISTNKTDSGVRSEIYFCQPFSHRLVNIAAWSRNYGLQQKTDFQMFPEKFAPLTDGGHVTVTGIDNPPHLKLQDYQDVDGKTQVDFFGPLRILLDLSAQNLNFTYSLVRPPDGTAGFMGPDGTWNGMIGQVVREEADLALSAFVIHWTRAQSIDYTTRLDVDYARIIARRGATEVDPWSFAMPLTAPVWIACFTAFVLALFISVGIAIVVKATQDKPLDKILYNYLRVLLQQDIKLQHTTGWSERALLGGWMVTVMVLMEGYSTNLISLLAVRYISQPFQSVMDVVEDPSVVMLWEANTAYQQYMLSAESGPFRAVAESRHVGRLGYLKSTEYTATMDTLISEGSHVLMIENRALKNLLAEHFSRSGSCQFYLSRELFLPFTLALIVRKHDPIGPAISKGMKAVTESGLYEQWLQTVVPNATACENAASKVVVKDSLSFKNVWGIFVVLLVGCFLSLLVLGIELALKLL